MRDMKKDQENKYCSGRPKLNPAKVLRFVDKFFHCVESKNNVSPSLFANEIKVMNQWLIVTKPAMCNKLR